jgi:hypothetical protein
MAESRLTATAGDVGRQGDAIDSEDESTDESGDDPVDAIDGRRRHRGLVTGLPGHLGNRVLAHGVSSPDASLETRKNRGNALSINRI